MTRDGRLDRPRILRILAGLLLVVSLSAAVWYHVTVDVLPFDDAYITYRYADNLSAGRGLVYNPDERVFGSSSPLYSLWLALLGSLTDLPTPVISVRGNAIFFLAAAGAMYTLVRTLTKRTAGAIAAASILLLHPAMLTLSGGGMETFLFVAMVVGAISAAAARSWTLCGVLAGLTVLARPEGALAAALLAVAWWIGGRPRPARFLLAVSVPALAWGAFATLSYGTPVPHSILAKMAPLYPLPPGYALLTLLRWIGQWSIPGLFDEPAPVRDIIAFLVSQAAVAGLLLDPELRRRGGALIAALFEILVLFYAVTNPLLFDWYTPGVFAMWLPAILVGLPALGRRSRSGAIVASTVAASLLVASVGVPHLAALRLGETLADAARTATRLRTIGYREAAIRLNDRPGSSERQTVATPETGAFGYYWKGRVLDACGLVSPQAIPFLPVPADQREDAMTGAISTALVESAGPDYVVTLRRFASRSLLTSSWFAENYTLIDRVPLPVPVWGSEAVLVFGRTGEGEGLFEGPTPPLRDDGR